MPSCAAGATSGRRLSIAEEPALSVFLFTPFLILLFPVVLVVGVFLIARGAVGKMRLSEPRLSLIHI